MRVSLGLPGLVLAVVALAIQLAAASVMPFAPLAASGVDRLVAASICHAANPDDGGAPAPRHAPDCAVCPLCHAIAHAGALLAAPAVVVAAPLLLVARAFALPTSRAPPPATLSAPSARGPPLPL